MSTSSPSNARAHLDEWQAAMRRNYFDADPHLQSLLAFHGHQDATWDLHTFGDTCVTLDPLVRDNNRDEHLPRLRSWDDLGNRVENIDHHPNYHTIGRAAYGTGVMGRYATPGNELETLAFTYMFAQHGEAGHACPFACTAGLIKILQAHGGEHAEWFERLYDPNYDTHFHGAQFLTEVQGGSDVGSNAVRSTDAHDGSWRITGEKWFCSVADAQMFLVTARPEGAKAGTSGLMAYAVPRHLPDGSLNHFQIRRLKFKLGTRSMASGEIDFTGAIGWPVGSFKDTVSIVLNTSRLYNAVCSAGILQRAWREAHTYAHARHAFGQPILAFPAVARTVADLRTTAYAARGLTFMLVDLADQITLGNASERDANAWRMLVNLNKFWTSEQGTAACRDAIEVLGGNGVIEEFSVLPRLMRDSLVLEQWEGPHNVLCAQVLRDSARLGLHTAMFDYLEERAGPDAGVDTARTLWDRLLALRPAQAAAHVRDVAVRIRPIAQAAALRAERSGDGTDPLLDTVIAHIDATQALGWDPLDDPTLAERVARLVQA